MFPKLSKTSSIVVIDPDWRSYESADLAASNSSSILFYSTARAVLRCTDFPAPRLFVVNLNIPDMSGIHLYHLINDRWPGVPVYLVSDQYSREDEIKARCSGATLYFSKPLQPNWFAAVTELVA